MEPVSPSLTPCHCCGLIQWLPSHPASLRAVCQRCATPLGPGPANRQPLSAALAVAALVFYPPAMLLPMLRLERLGHTLEDSLLSGIARLLLEGHWIVGLVVLLFSVLLPPLKLLALALLALPGIIAHAPHRALIYRLSETLGRFGMLDVMLMAILVGFVKLGDLVHIQAGPGLLAFLGLVSLSLLATLCFDPWRLWQESL